MNDQALLEAFAAATLPREEWRHREHIKVAYLYLLQYPLEEVIERLRERIQKLDAAHETPETLLRGYHETITRAWLRLIASRLAVAGREENADAFFDAHPELAEPTVLQLFYTPGQLCSPEAKRHFLEPDLAALPGSEALRPIPERRILEIDENLRLRPVEAADGEAMFDSVRRSFPEISPWMSWCDAGYNLEHAMGWASRQPRAWSRGEEFAFALEEVGKTGVVGTCGLNGLRWDDRIANLGYWVRTDCTGRGLASRTARRVAQFGLEELRLERVEIVAAVGNLRSQRSAERSGAQREAVLRRRAVVREMVHDAVLFSIVREPS